VIDTLQLSIEDYSISSNSGLQLMPSPIDLSTGLMKSNHPLFTDSDGKSIEGSKAFHNGEDFNLTIKPLTGREPDKIGCYVQFSVPKVLNGDNYAGTDSKGTKAALRLMQDRLQAIGMKTNINTAKLSRLDAFRNVEASEPFTSFQPILQVMQGQRMAKRDYGTTFLWGNTQQQICVYDKLAEMAARKQSIKGSTPNTIRFEHRLLNRRKVKDTTGIETVSDLLSDLGHVEDCYRKSMKKLLFKAESVADTQPVTVMEIEAELQYFIDQGGHWFERWIKARGLRVNANDYESILKAADNIAPNREALRRIRNTLKDARMDALNLEKVAPSKKTLGQLYTELQAKVLQ
jgi:hypothetical protein